MKFTKSMFDSIKESIENQKSSYGSFKDILKTEVGNSYIVRLIPNTTHPDRTFYHYFQHGWNSFATGQYQGALCPTTWGERCPICEERIKLYRENTPEAKKRAGELKRKENWLVNIFVVKDPKKPENDNTVKILRYGKQINKIINEAVSGEDADEFGAAIFDLTKDGCNFRIKVEKNEGDYPTYISSKFLGKSEIPGLTQEKIEEISGKLFELDKAFDTKTYTQLEEMLNDHFHCKSTKTKSETNPTEFNPADLEDKKMIDVSTEKAPASEKTEDDPEPVSAPKSPIAEVKSTATENVDDKINEILKSL